VLTLGLLPVLILGLGRIKLIGVLVLKLLRLSRRRLGLENGIVGDGLAAFGAEFTDVGKRISAVGTKSRHSIPPYPNLQLIILYSLVFRKQIPYKKKKTDKKRKISIFIQIFTIKAVLSGRNLIQYKRKVQKCK
jgi:hypothetical protein